MSTAMQVDSYDAFSYFPNPVCNKMDKQVKKIYGKTSKCVTLSPVDSLKDKHKFYKITTDDSTAGFVIITRALGCQVGGCDKPKSSDSIAFEEFYFMTAFDSNKTIKQVRVLEYTSNHGYEVASKSWLKQFRAGRKFEVGKNVDAISGATISVNSITSNVNRQVELIENLK